MGGPGLAGDFAVWLLRVLGIRTIVHDTVMLGRAPWVVGCPPDNSQMHLSQFELWPLGDPDARGFLGRWTYLSDHRV
jgi:hypothetical protein